MLKLGRWEEDALIERPFSEFQTALSRKNVGLMEIDASSFYTYTQQSLEPNQRAMRFLKGSEYWYGVGMANNLGYVVIEKTKNDEVVRAILRGRSVDSL